jgi:hypothetical protein
MPLSVAQAEYCPMIEIWKMIFKDVEGNRRSSIYDIVRKFAWRDWLKPWNSSVKLVGVLVRFEPYSSGMKVRSFAARANMFDKICWFLLKCFHCDVFFFSRSVLKRNYPATKIRYRDKCVHLLIVVGGTCVISDRSLKHWGLGFESHSTHTCISAVFVFLLSLRCDEQFPWNTTDCF